MGIKFSRRGGADAGRGDDPHAPSTGSFPPPTYSDRPPFLPPKLGTRVSSKLTSDEGKAFKIGPSVQRYAIDPNKKGADALIITHHSSTLPPEDEEGRMNLTSPPPANWPTEHQLLMHRIKTKIRGGQGSGRGDNPHDVDINELRAAIRADYFTRAADYSTDSDPTPPYGMERPKL